MPSTGEEAESSYRVIKSRIGKNAGYGSHNCVAFCRCMQWLVLDSVLEVVLILHIFDRSEVGCVFRGAAYSCLYSSGLVPYLAGLIILLRGATG